MTAPASGSGTCPACTACVARRRARSAASTLVMVGTYRRLPHRASDLYVTRDAATQRDALSRGGRRAPAAPRPRALARRRRVHVPRGRLRRRGAGRPRSRAHPPRHLRPPHAQMDGVTLLREIVSHWPDTAVGKVTAVAEGESAVACLQL